MRKTLKIIGWFVGSILVLLIALVILIQTPWGQNKIKDYAQSYLQEKLNTNVLIGGLRFKLPNYFQLKEIYVEDQEADSLLYLHQLDLNIDAWKLIQKRLVVTDLDINGISVKMGRHPNDSTFNFQFIADAFASPNEDTTTTSSGSPFLIDVYKLSLRNADYQFIDSFSGILLTTHVGDLMLHPTKIDITGNHYEVKDIELSNSFTSLTMLDKQAVETLEDTTASLPLLLAAQSIRLNNVGYKMLMQPDSLYLEANIDQLQTDLKSFDLVKEEIKVGNLQLNGGYTLINLGKMSTLPETAVNSEDSTSSDWKIWADVIDLNKFRYQMDDPTVRPLQNGMDYSHMDIQNFSLNAVDAFYSFDSTSADIKHIALQEKSGLIINDFVAQAIYTNHSAELKNFYLQTPGSQIRDHVSIHYPSLATLSNDLNKLWVDLNLKNSKISVNDLMLFTPTEQQSYLQPYKGQTLTVYANAVGFLSDLKLNQFQFEGLGKTTANIFGNLKNVTDPNKLGYDLTIKDLYTTKETIYPLLPDSIRDDYNLPDWVRVSGTIHGTIQDYFPNLKILSSDGNVSVKGSLKTSPGQGKEEYALQIATEQLNLGKILKKDSLLGPLTTQLEIAGTGFDPKTMNSKFKVALPTTNFMGYAYKGINVIGQLQNQKLSFFSDSRDPNLNFSGGGEIDLSGQYPTGNFDFNIRNADLLALHFTTDTISIAGQLHGNITGSDPDYPEGLVSFNNATIQYNGKKFQPDNISLLSAPIAHNLQNIHLNAGNFLMADITGQFPLSKAAPALMAHINRHFHISDSLPEADTLPYQIALNGNITYQPFLTTVFPDLQPFDTIPLTGYLDRDTMGFGLFTHRLIYGKNTLDSLTVHVEETPKKMIYYGALKVAQTPYASLWYPYIGGRVQNDSIYVVANVSDPQNKKQFTAGGAYYQGKTPEDSFNYFRLFKGLRFNYDIWHIEPNNKIAFGKDGFYIDNINIYHDSESLVINSREKQFNAPIDLSINNFSLSNLTRLFSGDTLLADGILNTNGQIDLSTKGAPKIDAILSIDSLKIFDSPVGNLAARVENQGSTSLGVLASLTGFDNDVRLNGTYYTVPKDGNDFDLNLSLNPLSLKRFEDLSLGSIRNSSGTITGTLSIKGKATQPNINGDLRTKDLKTNVTLLNADFTLPAETFHFEKNRIILDQVHIEDDRGRPGILDGTIGTRSFTRYFMNLTFNAQRWRVLHSTQRDNPDYFGDLIISTDLSVKGLATAPQIEGSVTVHDSTDLTYSYVESNPGMLDNESIVEFYDSRDTSKIVAVPTEDTTPTNSGRRFRVSRSSEINVNVGVDKNAKITVIVDPATGDKLQIKGEASLNASMDPSGIIGLAGTYKLDEGYYELNYKLLKRKFQIQEGSTVTLSGDPLDADADITAVYTAQIAPYDLVKDVASEDELVYFKQRMPFDIILKINGKVMKPDISFDIILPEDKMNVVANNVTSLVQSKLTEMRNDPSELNKQVFAALVLNNFMSNDPFSSVGSFDVGSAAKRSASRILSDQLNMLAGNLIQGVELNFDLNTSEDYSTGTKMNQTDLNISATKGLFNDRLKLTVGNDFMLEGDQAPRQQSSFIPGNLSASYLLTQDGKYRISAYRNNELQDIINGYVVETGLRFNVMLTYNKFKYIFISPKKYWQKVRAKREAKQAKETEEQKDTTTGANN